MFRDGGGDPSSWGYSAEALMRAARGLLPTMEADRRSLDDPTVVTGFEAPVVPIYMLLVGLAIENLAKGIYVARHPTACSSDNLPGELATHKAIELLESLDMSLSQAEVSLLERIETFVLWAGRYPIPRKLDDLLPRNQPGGGFGSLTSVTSADFEMLESLIGRLAAILEGA
jgi:hypothetical protein